MDNVSVPRDFLQLADTKQASSTNITGLLDALKDMLEIACVVRDNPKCMKSGGFDHTKLVEAVNAAQQTYLACQQTTVLGLFRQLTVEQQQAALNYRGLEDFGSEDFKRVHP
jgi:hypothetical protein